MVSFMIRLRIRLPIAFLEMSTSLKRRRCKNVRFVQKSYDHTLPLTTCSHSVVLYLGYGPRQV